MTTSPTYGTKSSRRRTLPMHPVVSANSFRGARQPASNISVLDAGSVTFCTSGRYGLAKAFEISGLKQDDEVLVPAYHCPAMTAALIWLGATPIFYKLHDDLSIDLEDLRSKLSPAVKSLLAVHYFGFMQDLSSVRKLCDEYEIVLIEDCAHCFFGFHEGHNVGAQGDFAIASPMKFFPIYDGGCVVTKQPFEMRRSRRIGLAFELKSLFNILERSYDSGSLPLRWIFAPALLLKRAVWSTLKRHQSSPVCDASSTPAALEGGHGFDSNWRDAPISRASIALIHFVSQQRIVERRRMNYVYILDRVSELHGCHPLYPELPEGCVPYVFPVVVHEDADRVHMQLRTSGVPLLRWEDANVTECAVSQRYSRRLFMLPCHQELDFRELDWIVENLAAALSQWEQPTQGLKQAIHS